jgi:hypothetical protein
MASIQFLQSVLVLPPLSYPVHHLLLRVRVGWWRSESVVAFFDEDGVSIAKGELRGIV